MSDIQIGSTVVRKDLRSSNVVLEVVKIFASGRGVKLRIKNPKTGSESSLRISEVRLATEEEIEAGSRLNLVNFEQWIKTTPEYKTLLFQFGGQPFMKDDSGDYKYLSVRLAHRLWNQLHRQIDFMESCNREDDETQ